MTLSPAEKICPLCGKDNGCQHGEASCWCTNVTFPKELLDMIPADKKVTACICKACYEKYTIK